MSATASRIDKNQGRCQLCKLRGRGAFSNFLWGRFVLCWWTAPPGGSISGILSSYSSPLYGSCPVNSQQTSLSRRSSLSPQLWKSAMLCLASSRCPQPGNSLKAVSWGRQRIHRVCFLSLRHYCSSVWHPILWKPLLSSILSGFFGCFRQESKSVPCYIPLVRNRSPPSPFL